LRSALAASAAIWSGGRSVMLRRSVGFFAIAECDVRCAYTRSFVHSYVQ
jgi:hypothetical protein